MKKNFFKIFLISLFSSLLLVGCTSGSNIRAKFLQEEYIVSTDDSIDFFKEFSVSGVDKDKVEFVSSNEDVLVKNDSGLFVAKNSGYSYVFAKNQDKTLASVKVSVKYKLSNVNDIAIDENGVMTWSQSYVTISSEKQYADLYEIKYADLQNENLDLQTITVSTNSYSFENIGSYSVSIKAISNNKYIESSNETKVNQINYGVMGEVENLKLMIDSTISTQLATFEWTAKKNAIYDVYINNVRLFEGIKQNKFEYNFSLFKEGERVSVIIDAIDEEGLWKSTQTQFQVVNIPKPGVEYKTRQLDDNAININTLLDLTSSQNANKIVVNLKNVESGKTIQETIESNKLTYNLDGKEEGIYEVSIISIGGEKDGIFYLNSKESDKILVAKLGKADIDVDFVSSPTEMAVVTFNEQNQVYRISYNGQSMIITQNDLIGGKIYIPIKDFNVGSYDISFYKLPKIDGEGNITEVSYGDYSTENVMVSDVKEFRFFVLDSIREISHSLDSDNLSTISFDAVENATYYVLKVNGTVINSDYIFSENQIKFSGINLKNFAPNQNGKYIFEINYGNQDDFGQRYACEKTATKEVQVLGLVSKVENQTNGSFKWSGITQKEVSYRYVVYKTGYDYDISDATKVYDTTTNLTQISQTLDEGYYVVKVYSYSTDANKYLNCDFYDVTNVYSESFYVTKQIQVPQIEFSFDKTNKVLTITTVAHGGEYKVYVDDVLDGSVALSSEQNKVTYIFNNQFTQAKQYKIDVVACAGALYDGVIYLDSEKQTISAEKLNLPEYNVELVQNAFGLIENENFVVLNNENAEYVDILLDGEKVNLTNKNVVDMADHTVFGSSFTITAQYKTNKKVGTNYYFDSDSVSFKFKRIKNPSNIAFYNGNLSYDNEENDLTEKYLITINVITKNNGSYPVRFFTDDNNLNFDLQSKIDQLSKDNLNFNSAYKQSDSVEIQVQAVKNSKNNDVHLLPSSNGLTVDGETKLTLSKLKAPQIYFAKETNSVEWEVVAQNSLYDIFVDGEKFISEFSLSSINLNQLSGVDFSSLKEIYVKSLNKNYLESDSSNKISIKQIQKIDKITVTKAEETKITLSLPSDNTHIEKVFVNESDANVQYSQGQAYASFEISSFVEQTQFTAQIISKTTAKGGEYFYLDSQTISFTLVNLSSQELNLALNEDNLVWNEVANDFVGIEKSQVTYYIKISEDGKTYTIETDKTQFSIQEIEDNIGVKLVAGASIKIKAEIKNSYVLSTTENAKGYYGEKESQEVSVTKLKKFSGGDIEVFDQTELVGLSEQKLNAYAVISFANEWKDAENVSFNMTVLADNGVETTFTVKNGTIAENYSLTLSGDKYYLTLKRDMVISTSVLKVVVYSSGTIHSDEGQMTISRLSSDTEASVSTDGILTIKNDFNSSILVSLTIEDNLYEKILPFAEGQDNKTLNLLVDEMLKGKVGKYVIKVLCFDEKETQTILPSYEVAVVQGYKLEGFESVEISNQGNIEFNLIADNTSDLVFTAKINYNGKETTKEFTPRVNAENSNKFYISMAEIVELFSDTISLEQEQLNFAFTVRKSGSVDADWFEQSFVYMIEGIVNQFRGTDLTKDYIIFKKLDNDTTTYFSAFAILKDGTKIEKYFSSEDSVGYIGTNGDEQFFTKTKNLDSNYTFTEVYGISVNEILDEIGSGEVLIKISRIAYENEMYYQYTQKEYSYTKLAPIDEKNTAFKIENSILSWGWTGEEDVDNGEDNTEEVKVTGDKQTVLPSAYYVYIILKDTDITTVMVVYKQSLDLSQIALNNGARYQFSVVAVSDDKSLVASDMSSVVESFKYPIPVGVEIKDGKIVFNQTEFMASELMNSIANYFKDYDIQYRKNSILDDQNSESYLPLYRSLGYDYINSPFYFFSNELDSAVLTLRFTKLVDNALTKTYYDIKIPALQLIIDSEISCLNSGVSEKKSYFELLKEYDTYVLQSQETTVLNTKKLIESLLSSNQGYGGGGVLLDDYARLLPAGDYSLCVLQQANTNNYIQSYPSTSTNVYVSAAPSVNLKTETVDQKVVYVAEVTPNETYIYSDGSYNKTRAQKYILTIRYTTNENVKKQLNLPIVLTDNGWTISYENGSKAVMLDDVISTNDVRFKINITSLRKVLNGIEEDLIPTNTSLKCDIYPYSGLNEYVVNGKSALFNVNYLDLEPGKFGTNFLFTSGQFIVETNSAVENSELLIRFKHNSKSEETSLVRFEGGKVNLKFDLAGNYEYVVLSLNGSISGNVVNVESETYSIESLRKLTGPTMTTRNNNLSISYNSVDSDYASKIEFYLTNDYYLANKTNAESEYYYNSVVTKNSTIDYSVGETLEYFDDKATSFLSFLCGNSGSFVVSQLQSGRADHLLDFISADEENGTIPLLSSDQTFVYAKMLESVSEVGILKGNIVWNEKEEIDSYSEESEFEDGVYKIYQVRVQYYDLAHEENQNIYLLQMTDEFYTTSNVLLADYVRTTFDYYKVIVTSIAGREISSTGNGVIQTIEGNKYICVSPVSYNSIDENTVNVLRSTSVVYPANEGQYIQRTTAPTNGQIVNGKVQFTIEKSIFGAGMNEYLELINDSTSVYAITNNQKIQTSGKFNISYANESSLIVDFTPDVGLLNDLDLFDVNIYVFGDGKLNSCPCTISDVYKLTKVSQDKFETEIDDEGNTVLNFAKFFNSVLYAHDNTCYKIMVYDENNQSLIVDSDGNGVGLVVNGNVKFTIPNNVSKLKFQVVNNQDPSQANPKLFISSDTAEFDVSKTIATDLNIEWVDNGARFEWNGLDSEKEYIYAISITIGSITHTNVVTTSNYYIPDYMGEIQSFSIKVREVGQTNINCYSDSVEFDFGDNVISTADMFSGGNGSEKSPYLISNLVQFANVSQRNMKGEKFYFKLVNDIEVDISCFKNETKALLKDFYGVIDGNGHTIKINVTSFNTIEETDNKYKMSITGIGDVEFSSYSSLFYSLAQDSEIKNLKISYNISINNFKNNNVIISPLALFSYGSVTNVKVSDTAITNINGNGINTIMLAGLVGVNYGKVSQCSNTSSFSYTLSQGFNVSFAYAGLVGQNGTKTTQTGLISNCFNSGDKLISVTVSNTKIVLSGICLINNGKISLCGNDCNFETSAKGNVTSYNVYMAGIALSSTGSKNSLEFVYNNATLSKSGSVGTIYSSAISHNISNGVINTLVSTVKMPLVRECNSNTKPTDKGTNYVESGSGTVDNIKTKSLDEVTINCGTTGYKMIISLNGTVYSVVISK